MPKPDESAESRMIKACEAAKREKNPNISRIAREYCVHPRVLYNRVKKGTQPHTASKPLNKALDNDQEESLKRWVSYMNDLNMPPPASLIEAWANRSLARGQA